MSRLKIFAIAGLAVIAPLGAARAADVPMSLPPLVQKAPVFVEEYQSGWYLRGDLGYRMNDLDGIAAVIGIRPSGTTIDDRFAIGGGGGYKSGWFRADVTIDYAWQASCLRGHARLPHEGRTVTTLANLYLDLGTWYGITPYVGAGAGVAWNRTSDYFGNALLLPGIADRKKSVGICLGGDGRIVVQSVAESC